MKVKYNGKIEDIIIRNHSAREISQAFWRAVKNMIIVLVGSAVVITLWNMLIRK